MEHGFGGAGRVGRNLGGAAVAAALAFSAACGGSDKPGGQAQGGQQTAGSGGIVEATPLGGGGLGGMGGMGGAADVCKDTPPGKLALIDDFNDGDNVTPFDPGREAFWFTIHDLTAGTLEPTNDFMPSTGGFLGTPSAHVVAKNFTEWGAALVVSLNHKAAVRCPYNAGNFKGLHFVARGSGVIRVMFVMPQTQDKEFGGSCDPKAGQICYDSHGAYLTLGSEWQVYDIPWDTFQQKGWGTPVDFDPKDVMSLNFSMEKEKLPVDLWVDDIKFWDGTPSPPLSGGEGGAGGASSGGEAGQAAGGTGEGGSAGSDTGGSE